jgi:hypothetical protein
MRPVLCPGGGIKRPVARRVASQRICAERRSGTERNNEDRATGMETINRAGKRSQNSQRGALWSADSPVTAPARSKDANVRDWPANHARSLVNRTDTTGVENLNQGLNKAEIRRRFYHILPGVLAFLLPLVPHTHPLSVFMLMRLTILATVFGSALS